MAGRYEHIDGCDCPMCERIKEVQSEMGATWKCRDGCGCDNCKSVQEIGDAREKGKQQTRVAKAYLDGVRRGAQ